MNPNAPPTVSAAAAPAVDPYLDLALDGVQLIEASAGTGKTFTLTTLVTRLVVERGLRLSQILAVTFTDAATQELRARLRQRLSLAAAIAREEAAHEEAARATGDESGDEGSDDTADATSSDTPEAALTRTIIRRQLQHESAAALAARLRRAEYEIDLAAVFTIHGFCQRVLAEHALHTGQPFDPPALVGSERELHDELAADLWRAFGADEDAAEGLSRLWPAGPDTLARDLGDLLRAPQLLPPAPAATPDPLPELQAAFAALQSAFNEHGAQARTDLDAAIAAKHIDGRKARAPSYAQAWDALAAGLASGELSRDDAHLDKLTPQRLRECAKTGCEQRLPASPLFDALAHWFDADRRRAQWLDAQALALLHAIRADAAQRLAALKRDRRLQHYDDLIDGVAAALERTHGDELARQLRAQYAVALVDEFQDTDIRQWRIFRQVFGEGEAPALFLIGDPKQAIYGFRGGDVHTYLAAKREADLAPPLSHNFRSRPGLLRAIEALYAQAGDAAFVDPDIRFHPVHPGPHRDDGDYRRSDANAPALTVRALPPPDDGKAWSAPQSRELATDACVADIHAVLSDARAGRALIDGDPVQPGDIAVLVRNHAEATRMHAALTAAGIPAVAAGKQSLFASEQAGELLAVLEALLQPADEGRLRAALATVLIGVDAAGIERLDHDGDWQRAQQLRALDWRERWQRHGPLALVNALCAANAERLLGLVDGERRLTNLVQLGELLQQAHTRALGLHGLVDWLRRQMAHEDFEDEQQLLRLESDARRVQILTLHKSKGLEFALVYLPFVGIGRKPSTPSRHCRVPSDDGHVLHWKAGDGDEPRWQDAVEHWQREQRAEDARLLYVGLTRAEHALWLACGPLYQAGETALASLLRDPDALRNHADIAVDARATGPLPPPLPLAAAATVPPARQIERMLPRDWWVHSFSQLRRADAGEADVREVASAGERGADDEVEAEVVTATEPDAFDRRFAGTRFGNVLHDALEHLDFAAWRDWRDGGDAPPGQHAPLRTALLRGGYPDADLDDGVAALLPLVGHTLTIALPEGVRLCELPPDKRRAEMEFHFALQPTDVDALLALLHGYGLLRERHAFGARRRLEGLMTGKIDLTYTVDFRWYVLDYKSNRLPGYDPASLDAAMAHSEYDLQALIYTLALHRWLRFRQPGYDYRVDFGGVRYLFCRGLGEGGGHGVHAHKPPPRLVEALDRLFAGNAAGAAP